MPRFSALLAAASLCAAAALSAGCVQAQTAGAATAPAAQWTQATPREGGDMSPSELVAALQEGGTVMLIRHERTEVPSRRDDYTQAPERCEAQRNLSVAGAAGAHETERTLELLGIRAEPVIASPMCRGAETARFMFGAGYEADRRLMHHDPSPEGGRDLNRAKGELRAVIAEAAARTPPGSNAALVSHGAQISQTGGMFLQEGEIIVLRPGSAPGEAPERLGHISGSALGFQARFALARAAEAEAAE